ncbi:MAG: Hpt domain-containing protein [Candidatus Omnitrophota bacterium]|nr:Hpt domain-containing protein [Candidatus Omnitrophota bacterium]MDZ4243062.1 Hpt domain-containing protein [Candidatus Omnitrophota bacterium]
MDKSIFDLEDVLERVQGDKDLLLELMDIFSEDYAEKKDILLDLLEDVNFEEIRNVAHSIKGAAGNISAKSVHAVAERIEKMAEHKEQKDLGDALRKMDEEFAKLVICMDEVRREFGTS